MGGDFFGTNSYSASCDHHESRGLETMLMNYYRQIDRSKIQFDFMVHRAEAGRYDAEILKLGGRIFYMPSIRPGNYRKYFRLLDQFFLLIVNTKLSIHTSMKIAVLF